MKLRAILLLLILAVLMMVLVGCSGGQTADTPYECTSSCRSNSGYCILSCGPDHHTYLDEFLEEHDQTIELDPVDSTAYLLRGMVYLDMGQIQGYVEDNHRALEDFERVIELDPENWQVYSLKGQAYQELGLYEKAILLHDKTIELTPNYPPAYHFRANAYSNLSQYQQAMQDYDRAIELDSRYMDAIADRAITCDTPEALKYC